jgi:hypothetical protein
MKEKEQARIRVKICNYPGTPSRPPLPAFAGQSGEKPLIVWDFCKGAVDRDFPAGRFLHDVWRNTGMCSQVQGIAIGFGFCEDVFRRTSLGGKILCLFLLYVGKSLAFYAIASINPRNHTRIKRYFMALPSHDKFFAT